MPKNCQIFQKKVVHLAQASNALNIPNPVCFLYNWKHGFAKAGQEKSFLDAGARMRNMGNVFIFKIGII